MWTTPVVTEIAVGLEINCYACADLQTKDDNRFEPAWPYGQAGFYFFEAL